MLLQSSIKLFYAAKKVFCKVLDKSALALPSLNFMPTCSKVTKDQISQRRIAALRLPPLAILAIVMWYISWDFSHFYCPMCSNLSDAQKAQKRARRRIMAILPAQQSLLCFLPYHSNFHVPQLYMKRTQTVLLCSFASKASLQYFLEWDIFRDFQTLWCVRLYSWMSNDIGKNFLLKKAKFSRTVNTNKIPMKQYQLKLSRERGLALESWYKSLLS